MTQGKSLGCTGWYGYQNTGSNIMGFGKQSRNGKEWERQDLGVKLCRTVTVKEVSEERVILEKTNRNGHRGVMKFLKKWWHERIKSCKRDK